MARNKKSAKSYSRMDLPFAREAEYLTSLARDLDPARRRAHATMARRLPVAWRRDISDEYNLPAREIRDRIDVEVSADSVLLIGRRRPIGLINFGAKWRQRQPGGAIARIYKHGANRTFDGTFIATGRSGNRHIFRRENSPRFPIRAYYGPSMPTMFRNADRRERMLTVAREIYTAEMARLTRVR